MIKNLPALQETWLRSLGWEGSLKKGIATHSSILAWRIPKDRGAWWAAIRGVSESDISPAENSGVPTVQEGMKEKGGGPGLRVGTLLCFCSILVFCFYLFCTL